MSALTPYIAPWQTDFERQATQVNPFHVQPTGSMDITVPQGQWWRIVYVDVALNAGATAGNRSITLNIQPQTTVLAYIQGAAVAQPASSSYSYIFGPQLTAYSNVAVIGAGVAVQTIPDVLLGPGSFIAVQALGFKAGDTWGGDAAIAVEVYTPRKAPSTAPLLTPLLV